MKIKDLKPAAYNPRKITDEQLVRLKKALLEFGDLSGLIFNRKTGNLVGGHQRIKCLPPDAQIEKTKLKKSSRTGTIAEGFVIIDGEKFSYREVDWPLEKEKAANIAANKQGGEFDDELLAEILKELSETPEFSADLLGFEDKELSDILSSITKDGQIEDDEVPEVNTPEPITKTGDLYILGSHRLLCGDATKKEDIERLMDGEKAGMVFTDPPYGINIVRGINKIGGEKPFGTLNSNIPHPLKCGKSCGVVGGKGAVKPRLYRPIIGDDKPFDPSFLLDITKQAIIFGANNFSSKLPDSAGWLVWDKGVSPDATFSACELAWTNIYGHIKRYEHRWSGMVRSGSRDEELQDRVHPTQKPVGLLALIIQDTKGKIFVDFFLGSGSTLIACEKTGRICYGMEIDPHYCDVIVTRYCQYTGNNKIIKNGDEIEWHI